MLIGNDGVGDEDRSSVWLPIGESDGLVETSPVWLMLGGVLGSNIVILFFKGITGLYGTAEGGEE